MKNLSKYLILIAILLSGPAYAVLPNIFATQPTGTVAASLLDQNFTFLESQSVQALATTGSSNTYVATPADAWVTSYSNYSGRALTILPNFTNTSSSTINVSSIGAATIYKNIAGSATAIASGDMVSGVPAILVCDGTNFWLTNPTPSSAGGGGAMVLLSTQTISTSTANISDTTHITSSYSHYRWEISNLTSSNTNVGAYITVQQGGMFIGGSNYYTSGFSDGTHFGINSAQIQPFGSNSYVQSGNPSLIVIDFWNPSVATNLLGTFSVNGQITVDGSGSIGVLTSTATTGIKLTMSSGSISTAVAKLYGIQ